VCDAQLLIPDVWLPSGMDVHVQPLDHKAHVNKLVPCAWLLSGTLEVRRLQLWLW